jgi:tRNA (guanosine-2'-O-)-methyltransferase
MKPLSSTEAKRLHRDWRRRTDARVAVLLDNVQTPFNVGAIVRTAAAFRIEHLWIAGGAHVTPDHPKSRKTSLGTERLVPWTDAGDVASAVAAIKAEGFRLVGIELAGAAAPLQEADLDGAVCLVLGHEDRGLSAAALGACDAVAFIPTPGKVGSLNVATAAGIALYEVRRREWARPAASDAAGVDLDADATGGTSGGGEGVGEHDVIGGAQQPPPV